MDEADRILDLDFEEEVNQIMASLPDEKKVFLFSATMTKKVSFIFVCNYAITYAIYAMQIYANYAYIVGALWLLRLSFG